MLKTWAGLALAGAMVMLPAAQGVAAQATGSDVNTPGTPQVAPGGDAATSGMSNEQLLTMTVHEAWVASGRNEDKFFAMVSQLTELSAQKRGVTLPDNMEAGQRAGAHFKQIARRDPGQLLYVVVDQMVRHVGGGANAGAAPAAATK